MSPRDRRTIDSVLEINWENGHLMFPGAITGSKGWGLEPSYGG